MKLTSNTKRWIARVIGALAVVYIAFAGIMYWLMTKPPAQFAPAMSALAAPTFLLLPFEPMWFRARAGALQIGDAAPDFDLLSVEGAARFQLSSERGSRPVVLIFGSYT
jgi:hypothetical protein